MNAIEIMRIIFILTFYSIAAKVLAAETMAIVARIRKARKQIRIRGGIPLIVSFLNQFIIS